MHRTTREWLGVCYWASAALASVPLACGLPAWALAATDPPAPPALVQLPRPAHDRAELVRGARRLVERERATFDLAAAAEGIGSEPAMLFAFVRDRVRFDPYPGSMRGALGTLWAQGGNAIDRSQLLAALLAEHGYGTRLVYATLTGPPASRLGNRAAQAPSANGEPPISPQELARITRLPLGGLRDFTRAAITQGNEASQILQRRVRSDAAFIAETLRSAGVKLRPSGALKLSEVSRHVWVQAQIDGEWVDFDSSFPDARPGQRFAEPHGELESDLPTEWVQGLTLRVLAAPHGAPGKAVDLLNQRFQVPDLVGRDITLVFAPRGSDSPNAERALTFQPVLTVGSEEYRGELLALDEDKDKPPGDVWLEVGLEAPGKGPERIRRLLAAGGDTATRVAPALIQEQIVAVTSLIVAPGAIAPGWLGGRHLDLLESLGDPTGGSAGPVALDLWNIAAAATQPSRDLVTGESPSVRRYQARPLVLAQRVRARKGQQGALVFSKSIDIVYNRLETISADAVAGIRQGVLETELERLALEGFEVANASLLFEGEGAAPHVLRPGEVARLTTLVGDSGARQHIAEDLESGFAVILAPAPKLIAGSAVTGWWRVRIEGGETLGRLQSGGGQSMTERAILASPSGAAAGLSAYCGERGRSDGWCNPCLITALAFVGIFLGWASFAAAAGLAQWGIILGQWGLSTYAVIGGGNKVVRCIDWFVSMGAPAR